MCIAAGENSSIVASGEKDLDPCIHIWDSKTLNNIGIIQGFHKDGVKEMIFFDNNKFLITCGSRHNTPILVYSMKNFTLLLST
jgi:WD40 repeat protein